MDSRSVRETDSPSASSSILPHLRASRRASVTSLSNSAQLDKESLTQALDHIHSTASQTETLTTFNEYTSPPSSSSGLDSRGLASELQGGLSGLYTRLRASVGNVKDIVNLGGDDAGQETTSSLKSFKSPIQSPAPSNQSIAESNRAVSSSTNELHIQRVSVTASGQPSPVGARISDTLPIEKGGVTKLSKPLANTGTSSRSAVGSFASVKSPLTTLTQASLPTTVSPAVAEVNISAVRPQGSLSSQVSNVNGGENTLPHEAGRHAPTPRVPNGAATNAFTDSSDKVTLETQASEETDNRTSNLPVNGAERISGDAGFTSQDESFGFGEAVRANSQVSQDTVQPFPDMEVGNNDENVLVSSSDGDDDTNGRPRIVATTANAQDDVFQSSKPQLGADLTNEPVKGASYQHLELPLMRPLGPSLMTESHTSNPSISPVSSSGAGADHSATIPFDKQSRSNSEKYTHPFNVKSSATQLTPLVSVYNRDPTTMNVFSQVKNKVLNKQYWMKDENARDCFCCGDPFSTFRRKHHCSKSQKKAFCCSDFHEVCH